MPLHTEHPTATLHDDRCAVCRMLRTIERRQREAQRMVMSPWVRRNLAGEQHSHETAKR